MGGTGPEYNIKKGFSGPLVVYIYNSVYNTSGGCVVMVGFVFVCGYARMYVCVCVCV